VISGERANAGGVSKREGKEQDGQNMFPSSPRGGTEGEKTDDPHIRGAGRGNFLSIKREKILEKEGRGGPIACAGRDIRASDPSMTMNSQGGQGRGESTKI